MALYLMCFMGGTPLGAPLVGLISDAFGPRAGVVNSGAISAIAAVVAAVVIARQRAGTLTAQVGGALPHPQLRLHRPVEPVVPAAGGEPPVRVPVPATAVAAGETITDAELAELAVAGETITGAELAETAVTDHRKAS
jgi:hypothetical protein